MEWIRICFDVATHVALVLLGSFLKASLWTTTNTGIQNNSSIVVSVHHQPAAVVLKSQTLYMKEAEIAVLLCSSEMSHLVLFNHQEPIK